VNPNRIQALSLYRILCPSKDAADYDLLKVNNGGMVLHDPGGTQGNVCKMTIMPTQRLDSIVPMMRGKGRIKVGVDTVAVTVPTRQLNSVSLWKAADLTPIGTFSTGSRPKPVARWLMQRRHYFWITLQGANQLARLR
jgi:hypothetical protein